MSEFRNTVFQYFQTDDIPTEEQFQYAWNSVWFKDEKFSISDVTGLENALQNKLGTSHASDANAHTAVLLKKDGSNLNDADKAALKTVLGVGEIPDNVALVDMGEPTDVFNKDQIRTLYMALADYVVGGKIRADKIEALGLTTLIEVSQTSLASFAANSANYTFEQNDIIAIPNGTGNFALFIFKGGTKTVTSNYLPTGLTNITIAMVSGLQTALDSKVQKPTGTGGFFASQSGTTTTWVQISPASYYLNYWDGSNFRASNVYQNGTKLGIGTQTPSEMLHLSDGRIRAKALVLDVNSETLPNQITTNGTRFSGTSSGGIKRGLMYNDYADLLALSNGMTDAQKTEWKTAMNGGWTTNTMSVGAVSPKVVKNSNLPTYITVEGANLNLNPTNFSLKLVDAITGIETVVPNSQVQLQNNGLSLIFWYNFSTLAISDYYIRLDNGVAILTTNSVSSIMVRDNIQNVDLSLLTWSRVCITQSEIDNTLITGVNSFIFRQNANNTPLVSNNASIVAAAKSSQILSIGDNLVINGSIQIKAQNGVYNGFILGLAQSSISTQLVDITDVSIGFTADGSNWLNVSRIINKVKSALPSISLVSSTNLNLAFTLVKQGNVVSITWRYTDQYNATTSATINKTITDDNYSLYLVGTSGNIIGDNTIIINDIYKF